MTAQPRYLVRCRFARDVVQTDALRLTWRRIYKETPTSYGGVRLEDTGKRDRTKIEVRVGGPDRRGVILARGHRTQTTNWTEQIDRTAADVKQVIRAIRPSEAERLDVIDEQIALTRDRLARLQEERQNAVREAWTKAHVVRLAEVEELIADA